MTKTSMPALPRLASIDAFRALTMLLMIFVNDLWSLHDIPGWLGHTAADVDGMGLADWVFPGFLFIVGLSIPFAIQSRFKKGDSKLRVLRHIGERSVALWVMGLFMVNLEMTHSDALLWISKPVWTVLMIFGFMLVWNSYGKGKWWGISPKLLQPLGVLILVFLALSYRSGEATNLHWMRLHWWGILGLIGWGYFLCATLYLVFGNSLVWISVGTVVLYAMNAMEFLDVPIRPTFVVGASIHASVMLGVLTSIWILQQKHPQGETQPRWSIWLGGGAIFLLIYGFATRPLWGISKIMGTPSWVAICAGISLIVFLALYWLCDRKGIQRWMVAIAPAGRSTLTCYLVPYWAYVFAAPVLSHLPNAWTGGWLGILKSLVFAFLVIQFTRLLELAKIRVRV